MRMMSTSGATVWLLVLALGAAAGCARESASATPVDPARAATLASTQAPESTFPESTEPTMSEPPMMPDPGAAVPDPCNAELAKPAALGQPATTEVVEQARRDAHATTVRVLKPGQMVTMEFIVGRLNIDVDDANVIINMRCG